MSGAASERGGVDSSAFAYQQALIEAIERHVRMLRWRQVGGLRYRGADFGRVIAIELYFRLINDRDLRSAYERNLTGEILSENPDEIPVSTVAYWILEQMTGRAQRPFSLTIIRDYLRDSYQAWRCSAARRTGLSKAERSCVAMLALSSRFYEYLRPVAMRLDAQVLWLAPTDNSVAAVLAASGEKVVLYGAEPKGTPLGALPKPLLDWTDVAKRYDEFEEILREWCVSAVVVAEGNNADDETLALAARSLGVRSVCIQQGWSPVVHNAFRNMAFDAFCAWGPEFATLLKPYNPRQTFSSTGSHRISPLRERLRRPGHGISFFLQKDSVLIAPEAWEEMLRFIAWTAETWPDRPVLVRTHPAIPLAQGERERLCKPENVIFCPASEVRLVDVLDRSAVAVAIFSTTLIEATARLVVPLIVNVTGAPRYNPDLEAIGGGVEVHDFRAARAALRDLLDGHAAQLSEQLPALVPRFFARPADLALDAIAEVVESPSRVTAPKASMRFASSGLGAERP